MALKGFWGFDNPTALKYPEFTTAHTGGSPTGRDGVAQHATSMGGNSTMTLLLPAGTPAGLIVGCALLLGAGNAGHRLPGFSSAGGSSTGSYIAITVDNRVGFYNSGNVLQVQSAPVVTFDAWGYCEVKFIPHPTAGTLIVRWNEIEVINWSGFTAPTTVDSLTWNCRTGNAIDDMYLLDLSDGTATDGRPNNAFLGDCRVAHAYPTGDGATVTLTPSTGTNHAALVDENPVNTTDYVSGVGGGGSSAKDLYAMADLPANAATVYGVRVGVYGQKTDAGAASVKHLVREPDGSETAGPAAALSTTYGGLYGPIYPRQPVNGSVWSPADINNMQAGVQVA